VAHLFSVSDIMSAFNRQKLGKSFGLDGLLMEALLSGGNRLHVMTKQFTCALLNLFIKSGYVPSDFYSAAIVPLVKCKIGDITDVNNYRAIAISNAITTILEDILFDLATSTDGIDDSQFGFKWVTLQDYVHNIFKCTVDCRVLQITWQPPILLFCRFQ